MACFPESPPRLSLGRRSVLIALPLVVVVASSMSDVAVGQTVTWSGGTMTWSQPDSTNWSGATYGSGDTGVFAGAGTGNVTVAAGGVTPGQVSVTSGSYTMAGGPIVSSGSLTISGGVLTLVNTSTFSGQAVIQSGSLQLGNGGSSGALSVPQISGSAGGTLVFNRSIDFSPMEVPLSGGIGVTQRGSGMLDLAGSTGNTYSGPTNVLAGRLNLNKSSGNAVGGDLVISGARLTFGAGNQIADTAAVTMSGAGAVFNGTAWNVGQNFSLNETIASLTVTGGIVMPGSDTATTGLVVTGAATFTGGAGNTEFLLNSGGRSSFGSLALVGMTGTASPGSAAPNTFRVAGNNTTRQSSITVGPGGLSLDGSNLLLQLGTGSNARGSRLDLDGDVTTLGTVASAIMPPTSGDGTMGSRDVALSGTAGGNVTRTFTTGSGGADLTIIPRVVNGAATTAGIRKLGGGRLTLGSPTNSYTGATTISAGTLALDADAAFASSPAIIIGDAGSVGAVLDISAKTGTFQFGSGQTVSGSGTLKMDGGDTARIAGTFAPGNSAGLFTLDSGTTLLSGTTHMEILGSGRGIGYDAVDLANSAVLDYANGALLLDFGSSLAALPSYQLFGDGLQTISGSLAAVTITGSNYAGLSFSRSNGVWTSSGSSVADQTLTFTEATGTLVIVPEPAAGASAAIGVAAAAWAARRISRRRLPASIRPACRCSRR